jgi:hypothetical protein
MADWLILESTREELMAMEVNCEDGKLEVRRAARMPLLENFAADPDVIADAVRKLLPGSTFRQALLVVPRDVVVLRQFEIPPVPPEELPDLVRFQAATKFSTPAEELNLDYIPFSPRAEGMGRSVLAASIDKDLLERWEKAAVLLNVQLVGCTVSAVAMAELVARHAHRSHQDLPPTAVLYAEETKVEFLLLDEGIPLFSSTVHIRLEGQSVERLLEREWKRAQVQLNQVHPGKDIEQAVYCGRQQPAIEAWLNKSFAGQWTRFDPAVSLKDEVKLGAFADQISLPAIGWGLAQERSHAPTLDFLRPRKAEIKKDWRYVKWGSAAAAIGLLLLGGYATFQYKLSALAEELQETQRQTRVLESENREKQPTLTSQELMRAWTASRKDPVEFVPLLKSLIPNTDRLYFQKFDLEPGGTDVLMYVSGNGRARARADVERMYEELETNGFRVRPSAINLAAGDPDFPISFELRAECLLPLRDHQQVPPPLPPGPPAAPDTENER